MTGHAARWASIVSLSVGLAGCAVPNALCFAPDAVRTLDMRATSGANGDRPVAVDVVFATDDAAATALAGLSARDYFSRRDQLLADFPEALRASSWELVPGQHVDGAGTAAPCGVVATYLFADYASPGAHRLRLTEPGKLTALLGPDGAEVVR
jgi:type VI secretion system protein